jgi:choline-glycine betaine transporter
MVTISDENDFSQEKNIMRFVRKNRWLSVDVKGYRLIRCNWVTTLLSSVIMWGFIIWSFSDTTGASSKLMEWKAWVSLNFTWFYILTRNIWLFFVTGLLFTKYRHLKLGRDDEKPEFSDLTWFAMLFSCGTGVSAFTYGVAEPMWFYRYNKNAVKIPFINDDQRAQMAMMIAYYQTGIHGWLPYIVIALTIGVTCSRRNRPMTMRYALEPVLGKSVNGLVGDIIDATTIACTTFGVCTSLGLGTGAIATMLNRLNPNISSTALSTKLSIIWSITTAASISVLIGLKRGIKTLSNLAFFTGLILMVSLMCADNPSLLFNSYVQSLGHYIQWILKLGWDTDAWPSFTGQLTNQGNWEMLTWGNTKETSVSAMSVFDNTRLASSTLQNEAWGQRSPYNFMNLWTVFYWAWGAAWAPFVGSFIARVSRGRTIGQVIIAGIFATPAFVFIGRNVFGTLGIKMQRIAEYTLGNGADIDWTTGSVNCTALGYTNQQPTSEAAIELAKKGYYALSCRAMPEQIMDIMEPYKGLTKWFQLLALVGVLLYFTTSSDSGSYIDDLIASQGLENPPPIQRVYWACTEGALAHALVVNGGIRVIQGAAIVATFPYTMMICFMCVALLRALKMETNDEDIKTSRKGFNTGMLDVLEGFQPESPPPNAPTVKERVKTTLLSSVLSAIPLKSVAEACEYNTMILPIVATFFQWMWIILLSLTGTSDGAHSMAWAMYIFFVSILTKMRKELRDKKNIYGNIVEDFVCTFTMYPFAIAQMNHESQTGDKLF